MAYQNLQLRYKQERPQAVPSKGSETYGQHNCSSMTIVCWVPGVGRGLTLSPKTIHIWHVDLHHAKLGHLVNTTLSKHEQERASGITDAKQQWQFQRGRACLRDILSKYTCMMGQDIDITRRRNRKPRLIRRTVDSSCDIPVLPHFSVSHTRGGVAMIAVADREVGIDVEVLGRRVRNVDGIMKRCFTAAEQQLVVENRMEFLKVWVRKEAFVKCTGEGIAAGGMRTFDVCGDWVVGMEGKDGGEDRRGIGWPIWELEVAGGVVAGVVAEGEGREGGDRGIVECMKWGD